MFLTFHTVLALGQFCDVGGLLQFMPALQSTILIYIKIPNPFKEETIDVWTSINNPSPKNTIGFNLHVAKGNLSQQEEANRV